MPRPITSTTALIPGRSIVVRAPDAPTYSVEHLLFVGTRKPQDEVVALAPNGEVRVWPPGTFERHWLELEAGEQAEWLRRQSNWNDRLIEQARRACG